LKFQTGNEYQSTEKRVLENINVTGTSLINALDFPEGRISLIMV
jgi:hypothetical protein